MTSEVAILNKQAVAMAADSAVTVGSKIFDTQKLFTLSKYHPVGIMVYSSANVMRAPVETAIKVFRNRLGDTDFDSLTDYSDAFLNFLKTDKDLFTEEAREYQCGAVIYFTLEHLRESIIKAIASRHKGWQRPTQREIRQSAKDMINGCLNVYKASNAIPDVTPQIRDRLRRRLKGTIDHCKGKFKQAFLLSDADLRTVSELCLEVLLREEESISDTGFVIAGFGQKEYFPQLVSFEFEASYLGVHKVRMIERVDMSTDSPRVIPFAQREMVDTFVRGRSQGLDNRLIDFIDGFFADEKKEIDDFDMGEDEKAQVCEMIDDMNERLKSKVIQDLNDFTKKQHVEPIEITVQGMPKQELAKMAAALVDLTAIKRRSTPAAETVGGPTDVAVISKGDGMVWIDRKHYFEGSKNLGFSANYFRERA